MKISLFSAVAGVLFLSGTTASAQAPIIIVEDKHDVSGAVSDMPLMDSAFLNQQVERGDIAAAPPMVDTGLGPVADGRVQSTVNVSVSAATVGAHFQALSAGAGGGGTYNPPDTNGAVGNGQFVQWVNAGFAVYDKTSGALLKGPVAGNSLWAGFGGDCETLNNGDPIVQFDKINQRWVMSQFAVGNNPNKQCVAVSTTADATGTFNRYSFTYPVGDFVDYPKMSTWPDGYYVTYNVFPFSGSGYLGAMVCAMDGASMRTGAAATQVCFGPNATYFGLLVADFDGTVQPTVGAAAFVMGQDSSSSSSNLRMWRFHVDFATPANSTFPFATPTAVPVPSYSTPCTSQTRGQCVAQAGTGILLESLGQRLMHRLVWRMAGNRESIVGVHTVGANNGGPTGIRWYEIRNPSTTPVVFQASTFQPDTKFRFMPSIAMDKMGNIAIGYSVSDASTFPSIAMVGRLRIEPANFLEAEQILVTGAGSQNSSNGTGGNRWGDYSALTVDPADDCTFYYTNEVLPANGVFNWNTYVYSFKFPNCH